MWCRYTRGLWGQLGSVLILSQLLPGVMQCGAAEGWCCYTGVIRFRFLSLFWIKVPRSIIGVSEELGEAEARGGDLWRSH